MTEQAQSLYEILGVEEDSTEGDIKVAYRGLSKRHHPDMPGGSAATFNAIKYAYEVLSDPERRAKYDETGATAARQEQIDPQRVEVLASLQQIITGIINSDDAEDLDLVDVPTRVLEGLQGRTEELMLLRQKGLKVKSRASKLLLRLRPPGDDDPLRPILLSRIADVEAQLAKIEETSRVHVLVMDMWKRYGYDVMRRPTSAEPFIDPYRYGIRSSTSRSGSRIGFGGKLPPKPKPNDED